MDPLDFEHEKLEYDTRKVLEKKWLLTGPYLWEMGNISADLGWCSQTATSASRVFSRIPGKSWNAQTFFSPGFLLKTFIQIQALQ